ncbi:hypothetical protein ACIBJI_41165 [Nocardia sp. NPDC050408]|uniref:hypothetical protein n=1 Tax=Nocardia sp. NPDC050408 TaxID=3364319 RepID=UPI003791AF57
MGIHVTVCGPADEHMSTELLNSPRSCGPCLNSGVVRVSAQRREPGRLRGEPIELPVTEFAVSGPVCWPEEVHNQVRVIVEARTYLPAASA